MSNGDLLENGRPQEEKISMQLDDDETRLIGNPCVGFFVEQNKSHDLNFSCFFVLSFFCVLLLVGMVV